MVKAEAVGALLSGGLALAALEAVAESHEPWSFVSFVPLFQGSIDCLLQTVGVQMP